MRAPTEGTADTRRREKSRPWKHTHGYISDAITTNVLVLLVSDDVPQVAGPREDKIQSQRPFLCLLCG